MNSRERVLTVFEGNEPDRVPLDYAANPGIDGRLKEHFGLAADDDEGLLKALHVDFRHVGAPYVGPRLHPDIPGRGVRVDEWGIRRKWIEHDTGGYWDYCDFPLRNASLEEVAAWPMPSPDDYDYSVVKPLCEEFREYAVYTGGPGLGDVINKNGMLRGMEQALVDLVTDDPAGLLLARRRVEIQCEVLERTLEAAEGGIDFVWMGEDLGTQVGPLISLDLYRKHLRPLHERIVAVAARFGLPVMIHSCGSSSWVFGDFIEMGIRAVDTLQPEARDMDPSCLKERYGDRLAFHGCISTAGPVATGTPGDVERECRRILDVMMPGGGYCFAPTHQLQDNSPTENVLAMYRTGLEYGTYRR